MQTLNFYPQLESTLDKLLNKIEKNWGYLQIARKGEFYVINILGKAEDLLKFKSNESTHSYRLFWYKRPEPSVFVQSRTTKTYIPATRTYNKSKTYQVCCKVEANALESSINQLFAERVKQKIILAHDTGDVPVVSVVRQ